MASSSSSSCGGGVGVGKLYGFGNGDRGKSSNLSSLIHNQKVVSSSDGLFLSGSSSFPGGRSMLSFEDVQGLNGSHKSILRAYNEDEVGEEELDEYFHQPEKKRRLTADQVQFLEKHFEVENKLEPERKVQLAKDLGLQPRQVAIWFQNRRARWKTKQMEKDYEALLASYNSLKDNYDSLLKEKEKLKAQVHVLTDKLHLKENERENSQTSRQSSQGPQEQNPIANSVSDGEVSKVPTFSSKQEDISSAKSDILDSESPHCTDGGHSSLLEPGDSSYAFEPDQSDLSQDEEDILSKSFMPGYVFPKLEDAEYPVLPRMNSCNLGFTAEDHAFWTWSY